MEITVWLNSRSVKMIFLVIVWCLLPLPHILLNYSLETEVDHPGEKWKVAG